MNDASTQNDASASGAGPAQTNDLRGLSRGFLRVFGVQDDGSPDSKTGPGAGESTTSADSSGTDSSGIDSSGIDSSSADSGAKDVKIRNGTPDRLRITDRQGDVFVFSPLEERTLPADTEPLFRRVLDREILAKTKPPPKQEIDWLGGLAGTLTVIGFLVAINVADGNPRHRTLVWVSVASIWAVILGVAFVIAFFGGPEVARRIGQFATLSLVILVSIGVPSVVAWRFSAEDLSGASMADLGRMLQVGFVSLACLVPGVLFFLFDRQRLSTLRDRFEQQIFRLDPNVTTLSDVYARYGRQIEETYGPGTDRVETRLERQRRWPIVVATVALAFGWLLALPPAGQLASLTRPEDLAQLIVPQRNAVAFGFLGAYFFAINLILRRYARGDLRPKAYTAITVRILVVIILGWFVEAVAPAPDGSWILVVAFLIGIVPETVLTFLREIYRSPAIGKLLKPLDEPLPLHGLEGIDLYDRARLLDEGVANIEALAHHDMIDLLLETRIPVARLVDWVDQAVLYLHVGATADPKQTAGRTTLANLRALGVRTATDLQAVCSEYPIGPPFTQLSRAFANGSDDTYELHILLAALRDDEWMTYLHSWRNSAVTYERTIELRADGEIRTDHRAEAGPSSADGNTTSSKGRMSARRTATVAPISPARTPRTTSHKVLRMRNIRR